MGTARRLSPSDGSSDSVWDDLRIVRSRSGFVRCESSDLAGTSALLQRLGYYDSADSSRTLLEQHVRKALGTRAAPTGESIFERPEDDATLLAAASLTALLLGNGRSSESLMDLRNRIGADRHRDHEYVRKQEDSLLRVIAREFVDSMMTVQGAAALTVLTNLAREAHDDAVALRTAYVDTDFESTALRNRPEDLDLRLERLMSLVRRLVELSHSSPDIDGAVALTVFNSFVSVSGWCRLRSNSDGKSLSPGQALAYRWHLNDVQFNEREIWKWIAQWHRGLITSNEHPIIWFEECYYSLARILQTIHST